MNHPQAKEPAELDYLSALSSMKAIRKIFETLPNTDGFFGIYLEAPFQLLGFNGFEKSLHQCGTTDKVIQDKLTEIKQWADGNLQIFNRRRDENIRSGITTKYYVVNKNDDLTPLDTDKSVAGIGRTFTCQHYHLTDLYLFCKQVQDLATRVLANPFESKINGPPLLSNAHNPKLSHDQIALVYIYKGKIISRDNCREIASKYRWTAKTSGESIYQSYLKYFRTADRSGEPGRPTAKKFRNKIQLFESILPYLTQEEQVRPLKEINTLKSKLEAEYE